MVLQEVVKNGELSLTESLLDLNNTALKVCSLYLCFVFSSIFILLSRESDQSDVTISFGSFPPSVYHTKMGKSR